jgi:hypothetical protein
MPCPRDSPSLGTDPVLNCFASLAMAGILFVMNHGYFIWCCYPEQSLGIPRAETGLYPVRQARLSISLRSEGNIKPSRASGWYTSSEAGMPGKDRSRRLVAFGKQQTINIFIPPVFRVDAPLVLSNRQTPRLRGP